MANSCRDILNKIVAKGAMTEAEKSKIVRNLMSADMDEIIAAHEQIGYQRGFRDGYAQCATEREKGTEQ